MALTGGILGILILGIAAVVLYFRRSLPMVNGVVRLSGIAADVEIIRDSSAVPHIYAANKHDALFGLGYVHAQDRLWQMEFQRRIGQARLSEIMGKPTIAIDRFLRTLGVNRAARTAWDKMPPDTKASIEAYITGINAFLAQNKGGKLPPEFTILHCAPEPWCGPDVIAWNKMMAWNLSSNMGTELMRADILEKLGPEWIDKLLCCDPKDGPTVLPAGGHGEHYEALAEIEEQVRGLMGVSGPPGAGLGSNCWVVDGTKSATGKPVLANDPHLGTGLPAIWYLAHISGGGIDAVGATIPGVPGIVIGRNQSLAWGVTNLNPDTQDTYRERLDSTGRFAEFQGVMEPLEIITETIKVKGKPDISHQVRITRHGPLISDEFNRLEDELGPDKRKRPEPREPFALRWTALAPEDTTIGAFLEINEARNCDELRRALRGYVAPPQNFLFADSAGNIGGSASGHIPIRPASDGAFPVEGWSGQHEWTGSIPFEELPSAANPPEHFIAAANSRPDVPADYPHFLGREWQPRYRIDRITEMLRESEKTSLDDHAKIHADTVSLQGREILPHLLALTQPENDFERRAIALLGAWDYDMCGAKAAPAIFAAWTRLLPRAFLADTLGGELMDQYEKRYAFTSSFLSGALAHAGQRARHTEAVNRTFRAALALLKKQLGPNVETWRWDKLHGAVFTHQPFDQAGPLKHLFSRRISNGGDASTVNPGPYPADGPFAQDFGAMYRQIIDLADDDGGRFILAGGQSGHFLSRHYDDYLADWRAVRYRRMLFTRAAVEADRTATLWLKPG